MSIQSGNDNWVKWEDVAEIQMDGYDTLVAERLGNITYEPKTNYVNNGFELNLVGGSIPIVEAKIPCPGHPINLPGPLQHKNIETAAFLLDHCPTLARQALHLIGTFRPMVFASASENLWREGIGSSSHCYEDGKREIYATIVDPIGLAQAIAHELAHIKLRLIGVMIESSSRLIRGPKNVVFPSPVVKNQGRPMTAVVHATYAFTYVVYLDLFMMARNLESSRVEILKRLLAKNLKVVETGYAVIKKNLEVDEAGSRFFFGLYRWLEKLIPEAHDALAD